MEQRSKDHICLGDNFLACILLILRCSVMLVYVCYSETTEGIELTVLSTSSQHPSITPPVQCSSRASMTEGNSRSSGRRAVTPASSRASVGERRITPVDSMEYINRLIKDKEESRRGKGQCNSHFYAKIGLRCLMVRQTQAMGCYGVLAALIFL
jgi:hypothetical protein